MRKISAFLLHAQLVKRFISPRSTCHVSGICVHDSVHDSCPWSSTAVKADWMKMQAQQRLLLQ